MLSSAAVGADAPGIAIPFIEALAGPAGVVAAATAIIANTVAGKLFCQGVTTKCKQLLSILLSIKPQRHVITIAEYGCL